MDSSQSSTTESKGAAERQAVPPHAVAQVRLLDADPQLGYRLSSEQLEAAHAQLAVGLVKRPVGEWRPGPSSQDGGGPTMMILSGFLLRSSEFGGRRSAQLFGPGDMISPLLEPDVAQESPSTWKFLTTAAMIVLDDRALSRISAFPPVGAALMHRWSAQAQRSAVQLDIVKQSHIEMRVMLMLWHFAQRWGRVHPEGIVLPVPLTHALLGQIVGARRPTVSLAVKQLERDRALSRTGDGAWLLDERFLSEAVAPRPHRTTRPAATAVSPAAVAGPGADVPGSENGDLEPLEEALADVTSFDVRHGHVGPLTPAEINALRAASASSRAGTQSPHGALRRPSSATPKRN